MRFINRKTLAIAGVAAALVAVGSTGTAVAGSLIGSSDIQDGSIRSVDIKDGSVKRADLSNPINRALAHIGKDGVQGPKGANAYENAYYAVAFYNAGDTNEGAIATVACKSTDDQAVSGGVQVLGLDAGANSRNTPVSSSFPGRMDWSTNTPKQNRLDGWIIQFGGNAQTEGAGDKAPEKVKVWALCMPGTQIPTVETYKQVG
jgi:hypothetical protein